MADVKIGFCEPSGGHGKMAVGEALPGKSNARKSFSTKSFGGVSSRQNQSGKIISEEIHLENKSRMGNEPGKIDPGPASIWLDTLSEETRKLLVNDGVSKLHYVWAAMKQRCYNPKSRNYKWYGARGVRVCKSWMHWQNFKLWALRNGYNPEAPYGECTLDRIDVDGDYEPSNCRWVSFKDQMGNRQSDKERQRRELERLELEKGKIPVIASDENGNVVHSFEDIEDAAVFFRPNRVDSARTYIKRALKSGGKCYKLYWTYRRCVENKKVD